MIDLLADQDHVEVQRQRYASRRRLLRPALEAAGVHDRALGGLAVPVGQPGRGVPEDCGRPGSPGESWSPQATLRPAGARHVRLALTAPDERIEAAAKRLSGR